MHYVQQLGYNLKRWISVVDSLKQLNRWQSTSSIVLAKDLERSPEDKVPLIVHWNGPAFLLPVFQ